MKNKIKRLDTAQTVICIIGMVVCLIGLIIAPPVLPQVVQWIFSIIGGACVICALILHLILNHYKNKYNNNEE